MGKVQQTDVLHHIIPEGAEALLVQPDEAGKQQTAIS